MDSLEILNQLEGENFSQFEPLTVRIRNILSQYPDGSQILKEILQNADDAEAREVKFLFDMRSFGTETLFTQSLQVFQGPALYAYNSSTFRDSDFESIRALGASEKMKYLGKTGKFGIGFNSVYHITDLPSFVSGKYLVILDPHARYLPGTKQTCGKRWNFIDHPELGEFFSDQFAPYKCFGCDMKNYFNGTLFRFPLRTEKVAPISQISNVPYTTTSVNQLLEMFKKEAPMILLFLKFIESVEIHRWNSNENSPKIISRVHISDISDKIRHDRQEMVSCVHQPDYLMSDYADKTVTTCYTINFFDSEETRKVKETRWLCCSKMGGKRARELAREERKIQGGLKLIPWGVPGVACKMPLKKLNIKIDQNIDLTEDGKIFCFLPLPTSTGLPIHVNASFELSLNRRDIWAGEDLQGKDQKKANWNTFLQEDVIAELYFEMLIQMAEFFSKKKNNPAGKIKEEIIQSNMSENELQAYYSLWPDNANLGLSWKTTARQVYLGLWEKKSLFSKAHGGCLVSAKEACFVPIANHTDSKVEFLLSQNVLLVFVPLHVISMFAEVQNITTVCPTLVRDILREKLVTQYKDRAQALVLLDYILSDGQYQQLEPPNITQKGVQLIPLQNGHYGTFQKLSEATNHYYFGIPSEHELLQTQTGLLLDLASIGPKILEHINSREFRDCYNLQKINPHILSDLLTYVMPHGWKGKRVAFWNSKPLQPSLKWISLLWEYIIHESEIEIFSDWPILPARNQYLVSPENQCSVCIFRENLSETILGILEKLGCFVLLDIFLKEKKTDFFSGYVHPGNAAGVLSVIVNVSIFREISMEEMFESLEHEERRDLLRFFSLEQWYTGTRPILDPTTHSSLLRTLPIWKTYSKKKPFVLLMEKIYFPPGNMEYIEDEHLIRRDFPYDVHLINFLGIQTLTKVEFYERFLFQKFPEMPGNLQKYHILQILEEFPKLKKENPDFSGFLSLQPFLPCSDGCLRSPGELYDPRETELRRLFSEEEPIYPHGVEFQSEEVLLSLRQLGLRTCIDLAQVVERAQSITNLMGRNKNKAISRATLLWNYLESNFERLSSTPNASSLLSLLSTIKWIPPLPPDNYYGQVLWYSGIDLYSPTEIRLQEDIPLICGVMPIFGSFCSNVHLRGTFGWNEAPAHTLVIKQLKIISSLSSRAWIWTGTSFALPSEVVYQTPIDLTPYVYKISSQFQPLFKFFSVKEAVGINEYGIVLDRIHDHQEKVGGEDGDLLQRAIKIVNLFQNENLQNLYDLLLETYIPCQDGILRKPNQIILNNTPWIRLEVITSQAQKHQYGIIHNRISIQLAEQLPITLASRFLISNSIIHMKKPKKYRTVDFYSELVEDGLNILYELIQNADDAGATQIKVIYEPSTFPSKSLLETSLQSFCGPALYFYNDAVFTESDFSALSFGTTKKRSNPEVIGSHGVGFSSVFSISDFPTIISGRYLLLIDPTGKLLTGFSEKYTLINWTSSDMASLFPDQFKPYCLAKFGINFNFEDPFKGTLIRLPLRMKSRKGKHRNRRNYETDPIIEPSLNGRTIGIGINGTTKQWNQLNRKTSGNDDTSGTVGTSRT